MIESHIQKIIFVDRDFLVETKERSVADFGFFSEPPFDTKVLSLPLAPDQIKPILDCMSSSDVWAGNVLVKPDLSERFMTLDSFAEDFAERKYRLWAVFCTALGAKRVSVTHVEEVEAEEDTKSFVEVGLQAKAPVAKGGFDISAKSSSGLNQGRKSKMSLEMTAAGAEPNLDEAWRIIQKYGLERDDMFMRMLDLRSIRSNQIEKSVFTVDTISDVKRVLDSSLRVKIDLMNKIYGGKAGFEKTKKSVDKAKNALKLTIAVDF